MPSTLEISPSGIFNIQPIKSTQEQTRSTSFLRGKKSFFETKQKNWRQQNNTVLLQAVEHTTIGGIHTKKREHPPCRLIHRNQSPLSLPEKLRHRHHHRHHRRHHLPFDWQFLPLPSDATNSALIPSPSMPLGRHQTTVTVCCPHGNGRGATIFVVCRYFWNPNHRKLL